MCGLAFWTSGKQKKSSGVVVLKEAEGARRSSSSQVQPQPQATPEVSRIPNVPPIAPVNETHPKNQPEKHLEKEEVVKPEVDNTTQVYRGIVFQLNFDQTVRHEEKFRAARKKDDLVVVVQVHNRPDYLRLLVESLRKARGVESILLIFSHDFWSPEINQVVASVDFCQVLQIFFPSASNCTPRSSRATTPGTAPETFPR